MKANTYDLKVLVDVVRDIDARLDDDVVRAKGTLTLERDGVTMKARWATDPDDDYSFVVITEVS